MASKPPLALSAVSIAADGTEQIWWSGDRRPYNRPQNMSFRTRVGDGFSDANMTLARRIDRDWNDLELYNTVVLVGDDGRIAYEGRIAGMPRSTQGGHSIAVQTAGWMQHASKDAKFTEIYVDRDTTAWADASTTRKAALPSYDWARFSWSQDASGLICNVDPSATAANEIAETWYTAPKGCTVAAFMYVGAETTLPTSWLAPTLQIAADTAKATSESYTLTLDSTLRSSATITTPRRYAVLIHTSNGNAATPAVGTNRRYSAVAVYGNHGLTTRPISGTIPTPNGLYASDVITNIASRFCPKLDTSGVQGTTLAIPHIVFKDRTAPFDAFLLLNGPHNYELAVWEDKTLTFRPYDLSDYDWQVRTDQPGVDVSLQGDTSDDLANYVVVEFDNLDTGQRDQVGPSDDSSLEDTAVDHPANKHGLNVELTVGLSFPATQAVAIAFGQSYLAEFNRPKTRGQITVQGHILDNAGHWQQAWNVRYGQTISVVNQPNDDPRLITETSYDVDTHTMTISTDNGESNLLEALVDYVRTGLAAAGLGN